MDDLDKLINKIGGMTTHVEKVLKSEMQKVADSHLCSIHREKAESKAVIKANTVTLDIFAICCEHSQKELEKKLSDIDFDKLLKGYF